MIAYNITWLANSRLLEQVKTDANNGRITPDELKRVTEKYLASFYTPNLLVRVGLFILTCIIVLFADGFLTLVFSGSGFITTFGWFIFLGILIYVALEVMVSSNFHYRSGVDDALLYITAGQFTAAFAMTLFNYDSSKNYLLFAILICLLSLYLTIRFADMLMTLVCYGAFLAVIYFSWIRTGAFGLATMPFVMMLVSAFIYWLALNNKKQKEFTNYQNMFAVLQALSLLSLYAAGNYFIVDSLSAQLNSTAQAGRGLPFGAFFWLWTILIPFVYVGFGIKRKDVVLLRTGLILITGAVLTFRNYYHVLPVDVALCLGGVIVLGVVYAVTKYLKTPKHGFTYAEPEEAGKMDRLKIESLIIAQSFSHAPAAPADKGVKFGGGDFGGGGSSGDF